MTSETGVLGQAAADYLRSLPRHRHGLSRHDVRASQEGRIVAATAELVAAQGYAGASVQAIARRAGVSRKTFYECFDDKQDAFLAAYRAVDILIERTITAAADSASGGSSPRELAAAAIRALLRTLAADPDFTRMFFLEALGAGARVRRRRDEAIEQVVAVLTPALSFARSLEDPPLAPIGEDLARAVIGAGIEAIVRHLVHHEPETLDQLAEPLTGLIDTIVLAQQR